MEMAFDPVPAEHPPIPMNMPFIDSIFRLCYPGGAGESIRHHTGMPPSKPVVRQSTMKKALLISPTETSMLAIASALGELATVIITLEEKDDVLWLPPAALRTFQGRTFVVTQDEEGNQRRLDVRLGIESDDRVEILEGLEEGQTVVGE